MNLEEAKQSIGKEVVLDEGTKPYTIGNNIVEHDDYDDVYVIEDILCGGLVYIISDHGDMAISPCNLKLKNQTMKNYKIRVTPDTSPSVQKLLFSLGYDWASNSKQVKHTNYEYIYIKCDTIMVTMYSEIYGDSEAQEITISQLYNLSNQGTIYELQNTCNT